MGFCRSCCRTTTEFFSSILLLCAVAVLSLGGFMLYKWKNGEETKDTPPPSYVTGLLVLGGCMALSNMLSFLGACTKTKCCLSMSSMLSSVLLLAQAILALTIFYNPSAIDQKVCPPGDAACLDKLDNLFKDPQTHAGALLATVCGVQIFALFSTSCLHMLQKRKDGRDLEEANQLEQSLLEDKEWNKRRDELEKKARSKVEKLHKAALSQTARDIIASREGPIKPLTKAGLPARDGLSAKQDEDSTTI